MLLDYLRTVGFSILSTTLNHLFRSLSREIQFRIILRSLVLKMAMVLVLYKMAMGILWSGRGLVLLGTRT